jgi:hypothetical protein
MPAIILPATGRAIAIALGFPVFLGLFLAFLAVLVLTVFLLAVFLLVVRASLLAAARGGAKAWPAPRSAGAHRAELRHVLAEVFEHRFAFVFAEFAVAVLVELLHRFAEALAPLATWLRSPLALAGPLRQCQRRAAQQQQQRNTCCLLHPVSP